MKKLMIVQVLVFSLAVSCSGEPEGAAVDQPAPAAGATTSEPLVPQSEAYRLAYSSLCGDGPYFTGGTEIEVHGGEVAVVSGEEPRRVGSLAVWDEIAVAAADSGRVVDVQFGDDGSLRRLDVEGLGHDDEFCVEVTDFEALD